MTTDFSGALDARPDVLPEPGEQRAFLEWRDDVKRSSMWLVLPCALTISIVCWGFIIYGTTWLVSAF